jgi:quinol monooxygenase YgiN
MPIRHTVAFALPFPAGSPEEAAFLREARGLASLPGVERFVVLRSLEQQRDLPWSLSMEFADQAAYDGYNSHPEHRAFVESVWLPTVSSFAESDFDIVDAPMGDEQQRSAS